MRNFHSSWNRGGIVLAALLCLGDAGLSAGRATAAEPLQIKVFGSSSSSILSGVSVPSNRAYYYSSGTVPAALEPVPTDGSNPFGDTKTQAISVLTRIQALVEEAGLTMADVVYLRAYLVADTRKENIVDYQGWFDAYAQFFNNTTNPNKTARSTVGVASLVNADWLVEVEAVAVYPRPLDKVTPPAKKKP